MAALVFPIDPNEDQLFDAGDGRVWVFKSGAWRLYTTVNGNAPISFALNRYDLEIIATTNIGNLEDAQVFTVANTTGGVKTINLQNPPTNRAMTVVLVVNGNSGTLGINGVTFADGVDNSLSAVKTIFVIFWDGAVLTVTANIKHKVA